MSRLWNVVAIGLAVAGVILIINGMNKRFGTPESASPDPESNPASEPVISVAATESFAATPAVIVSPTVEPYTDSLQNANPPVDVPVGSNNTAKPAETVSPPVAGRVATPLAGKVVPDTADLQSLKRMLLEVVERQGWKQDDRDHLALLLDDRRVRFRGDLLVRNSTFVEHEALYAHNLTFDAVEQSIAYWNLHRSALAPAAGQGGVPPEFLLAIMKVETNFGTFTGKESVFNVFWTLALGDVREIQAVLSPPPDYPRSEMTARLTRRALWARSQLRDLLYMARHGGVDPLATPGSFAGAFGLCQFIPSSYRAYGRDGNGDGVIDLDRVADAGASIANYLRKNGWPESPDRIRRRKAILTYNKSSFYADCVMSLADSIAGRWSALSLRQ
ncbi:MAG: hypothetical protein FJY67_00860 [Calditrichaeota bacterium]|nr:hypothetical protein [Calditrichota bacterium]